MRISHLNGLRALEAALRNGTFAAAAEEMGVTIAAVGQHIKAIEAYLDVKLFDRLPAGARPTAEARRIAERLTRSFTEIEQIMEELGGRRRDRRFVVTMSHFILEHWLSERLPGFHAAHPDLDVQFDTGEEYADLFGGAVDLAIRFSPRPGPEYAFEHLHRGWFFPVCTPDFAERHRLGPGTRDLTGADLFRLHDPTSDPAWVGWEVLLAEHGIRKDDPAPVERLAGQGTALAGNGLMISGLTESFDALASGRLVAPLGPDFVRPFSYGYRLVWPAGRQLRGARAAFRNWIGEEMRIYLDRASRLLGRDLD